MTEKRFHYHIDEVGIYYYICDGGKTEDKIFAEVTGDVKEVTDKLNELAEENENITLLAQHNYEESKRIINRYVDKIKKLEKELHLAHMSAMFSTVKSFNGDVSKRYYYSEETDRVYDTANHYGQYDKILDKKEIAMLLNEYETMLNGDVE